jgi:hypothetical protein
VNQIFHGLSPLWAVISPLDRGEQYNLGVKIIGEHESEDLGYKRYGPGGAIQVLLRLVQKSFKYVTPCKASRRFCQSPLYEKKTFKGSR